jgi:dTDP-4-dehydrorhamnose 3,5-epimerase
VTVERTPIDGLLIVGSPLIPDSRGFFRETYRRSELEAVLGRPVDFRQGNHSRSAAGVLRGFHSEPWNKLVYVVRGRALCVVADTRSGSSTFGQALPFELGDDPALRVRLFIARGLSNAFLALEETDYVNEVSEEFDDSRRKGFVWNDPTIGFEWPTTNPILSATDAALPSFVDAFGSP